MSTETSKLDRSLPDVCRNKHGGAINSELSNIRVHSRKEADRKLILRLAEARGEFGLTLLEAAGALGRYPNRISGRFTELRRDGLLELSGEDREGCAVVVIPKGQKKLF